MVLVKINDETFAVYSTAAILDFMEARNRGADVSFGHYPSSQEMLESEDFRLVFTEPKYKC